MGNAWGRKGSRGHPGPWLSPLADCTEQSSGRLRNPAWPHPITVGASSRRRQSVQPPRAFLVQACHPLQYSCTPSGPEAHSSTVAPLPGGMEQPCKQMAPWCQHSFAPCLAVNSEPCFPHLKNGMHSHLHLKHHRAWRMQGLTLWWVCSGRAGLDSRAQASPPQLPEARPLGCWLVGLLREGTASLQSEILLSS